MEKYGKTAVFLGGYGRIGDIGPSAWAAMAGLGSIEIYIQIYL